ncbi:MAG: hypoxanthine phosphoribosyltransferase [Pseudomonadota bacterium]
MTQSDDRTPRIEVIFPADVIQDRIVALARDIAGTSPDTLLVVAVLKGSFVFAADLIRAMHTVGLRPEVDFITLSSYRDSMRSSGTVSILRDLDLDVTDRDVLLVDDILESGRTLAFAKDLISARGARSISTCVLLDKPGRRNAEIEADFKAFDCPDVFVVGYGMDLAYSFRQLPFVGRVIQE